MFVCGIIRIMLCVFHPSRNILLLHCVHIKAFLMQFSRFFFSLKHSFHLFDMSYEKVLNQIVLYYISFEMLDQKESEDFTDIYP